MWGHATYVYASQAFIVYSYCLIEGHNHITVRLASYNFLSTHIASLNDIITVRVACYKVCPESDDTSILFCSSLEPSQYFHFLL